MWQVFPDNLCGYLRHSANATYQVRAGRRTYRSARPCSWHGRSSALYASLPHRLSAVASRCQGWTLCLSCVWWASPPWTTSPRGWGCPWRGTTEWWTCWSSPSAPTQRPSSLCPQALQRNATNTFNTWWVYFSYWQMPPMLKARVVFVNLILHSNMHACWRFTACQFVFSYFIKLGIIFAITKILPIHDQMVNKTSSLKKLIGNTE